MMTANPLTMTAQMGREPLPVTGEPQIAYVLIDVQANAPATPATRSPLNLNFVLDRSGSMRGPRLQGLKESLMQVIDHLTEADILSVVTFDDMVDLVIPAQPVTERAAMKAAVSLIEDGGGTAMAVGMSMGLAELQKFATPDRVNHMILLTDGMTRGDEEQCLLLAEAAGQAGIPIVPFGCGAEWDDTFLDEISARSGGPPPDYVRAPSEIGPSFLRHVRAAQAVMTRGVQVEVRFVAGITPRRVTQVAPFTRLVDSSIAARTVSLRLGDVEQDVPQRLLIELLIEPKRGGTFRIAQIEATTQGHAEAPVAVRTDVVVTFSGSANKRPKLRPVVLHYIKRVVAARLVLQALAAPEAERATLAPGIIQLFDTASHDLLEALWAGTPLSPENRKLLYAEVRELTHGRHIMMSK